MDVVVIGLYPNHLLVVLDGFGAAYAVWATFGVIMIQLALM